MLEVLVLILITFGIYVVCRGHRKAPRDGMKAVPEVGGWLPFFGHFFQINRDCRGFLQRCTETYGTIFTIRFGTTKMVVVTEREGGKAFIKAEESNLSSYKFFDESGIQHMFFTIDSKAPYAVGRFMRQSILSKPTEYLLAMDTLIEAQIRKLKTGLRPKPQNLNQVVQNTLQQPVLHSVLGVVPTTGMINALNRHLRIGRYCMFVSYFIPRSFMKFLVAKVLCPSRDRTIKHFLPAVRAHTDNTEHENSQLLRIAADKEMEQLGNTQLTQEEICGVLLVTYISMEGVGSVITQVIKELSQRPQLWAQLRNEIRDCKSMEEILQNRSIEACIMEGARLNANAMSLQRSLLPTSSIGVYDLSDADQISLAGTTMFDTLKPDEFPQNEFWPERFLGENAAALIHRGAIWFWGGIAHTCPGRNISIHIMQLYIAKIIRDFDVELVAASTMKHIFVNSVGRQTVTARITAV